MDGQVQRSKDGKEVRYPIILSQIEKQIAPAFDDILTALTSDVTVEGRFPVIPPKDCNSLLEDNRALTRIKKRTSGRRNRNHYEYEPEVATEIITKNPGILSCVAPSVAKQSNEEILKATAFADGLVENREAVKLAIFGAVFAFFNLIGWRILTTSTNPKIEKIAAFFNL